MHTYRGNGGHVLMQIKTMGQFKKCSLRFFIVVQKHTLSPSGLVLEKQASWCFQYSNWAQDTVCILLF